MTESLETILSQRGEAVSEQPAVETVAQVAEGESQQQPNLEAEQDEGEPQGQKLVPHEALHAEKQKVKRYTEQVSEFQQTTAALQRQVAELLQRVPAQQHQPPDFYEDPAAATRHTVQPEFERINQTLMAIAKDTAVTRFTEETVNEAEAAFNQAAQTGAIDPALHAKINSSPNPWAAAVQWYKAEQAQKEIGGDPAAYKAKLEAEIREKVLAEIQQGDGGQAQQRPVTMPGNFVAARNVGARTGPAWAGPAPLQDIFDRKRAPG